MDYYYHWLNGSVGNTKSLQCIAVLFMSLSTAKWNSLFHKTWLGSHQIEGEDEPSSSVVWFTLTGQTVRCCLSWNTDLKLTVSASQRNTRGMGKCRERGMQEGSMFSSSHTFWLISLLCRLREWQQLWTVLMWCQLCYQDGSAGDEWERERESRRQRERLKDLGKLFADFIIELQV